jgi:hypothetical protein
MASPKWPTIVVVRMRSAVEESEHHKVPKSRKSVPGRNFPKDIQKIKILNKRIYFTFNN